MAAQKQSAGLSPEHKAVLDRMFSEHGPVVHFVDKSTGTLYVLRGPTQDEYESGGDRVRKGDPVGVMQRELCAQTLVHGDPEKLAALFEKAPRVPQALADELAELAMGGIEITVKKG